MKTAAVAAVLYLLLKAWVHYQAHQWLEVLKADMSLHVAVSHDWLASSPFLGEVELKGLQISPFQLRQSLWAESLVIDFGGLHNLLAFRSPGAAGNPIVFPQALQVRIKNLQIPLTGRWAVYWDNPVPAVVSLLKPPCGEKSPYSEDSLFDMGYRDLRLTGELEYAFNSSGETLQYRHSIKLHNVGESTVSMAVAGLSGPLSPDKTAFYGHSPPLIRQLELMVMDQSFLGSLTQTCAAATGVSAADYPLLALKDFTKDLDALGVRLGPGISAALADYFRGEGTLRLKISPAEDFDYALWAMQPVSRVADYLPVSLSVNNRVVLDPYYEIDFARLLPLIIAPADKPADVADSSPKPAIKQDKSKSKQRSYLAVEIDALSLYTGFPVRLTHKTGKTTTGVLGVVLPNSIDIRVPMASGDVVFHVSPRDIETAEVYQ